jgi:subtilisin family serine protease
VTENHSNKPTEDLKLEEVKDAPTNLDPHLQQVIQAIKSDLPVDRSVFTESETGEIEVDVLAKLKDPDQEVPQLKVVQTIGQIVTGTVAVANIEEVRNHPNVISLKRATQLHPELAFSVPEIRADATQLHAGLPVDVHIDGSGVIVGIIDFGFDFLHHNFRNVDGTTRLLFLWDQRAERTASSPAGYPYGREYDAATINAALVQASVPPPATDPIYREVKFPEDPKNRAYLALGYAPDPTPINSLRTGQHGTHVMDIAAGNGRGNGVRGVAPGTDLICVHLAANDFQETESFGNSRRLLEAVKYVFDKAAALGRQCVVNLSLGTHGGPHDGSTLVEEGLDTLLETPGRAIVIAAGNSFTRGGHASGQVAASTPRVLNWQIGRPDPATGAPVDPSANEMEVWYSGDRELAVSVVMPSGQTLGPVPLGTTASIVSGNSQLGLIVHRQHDPNNGDNQLDILLQNQLPLGDWKVELSATGTDSVPFHAWIERDDLGQSQFSQADNDSTHTLGSISCGTHTIVVGSYDARHPTHPLSVFSSEGPTRDGKVKPEVSAPGQDVEAAWSLTHNRTTSKSGTSMAAPHVAGVVALLLQAAGAPLTISQIRDAVISTARNNPPSSEDWNSRYGNGRVDAAGVVATQFSVTPLAVAGLTQTATYPVTAATTLPGNASQGVGIEEVVVAWAEAGRKAKARLRIEIVPE